MITFRSDAYENISYFNAVAQDLLGLMGHSGTVPGALTADELPQALSSLRCGLEKQKNNFTALQEGNEQSIGLALRAIPLIHLLEASIKKKCAVLWFS